jgi:hypothetical protein
VSERLDASLPTEFSQASVNRGETSGGDLVVYPNLRVAFICGPQLRANSRLNPFPWFDSTQIKQGHVLGKEAPSIPPRVLTGGVSANPGSPLVTGRGARFLSEVDPSGSAPFYNGWLRIQEGANYREVKVASVQSDTQLTLASAWRFSPVRDAKADTYHYDSYHATWNYDHYLRAAYYDTALIEYINYYRTGDAAFLNYARKMADALWRSQYIDFGTVTEGPNHLGPRTQQFAGMMLRALDGKPEYWDYLYRDVRFTFDVWLKRNRNNSSLYYDIREDGYAQLYAVMLARVLPDRYPLYANGTLKPATGLATDGARKRAALLADAEDIAVNFFGRLQRPDGSWRWDITTEKLVNTEQPFMVGLYLESAVLLHQLTTNANVKANLREQITRACRHLYRDAYRGTEVVRDMPQYRWRGVWYFWGGGTVANPRAYERGQGERGFDRVTNGDPNVIRGVRHLNSTIHHAFGYAYAITGDASFREMGDEIFGASFGDSTDTLRNLATVGGKEYAMNYRASGRYLVWRLAGAKTEALTGSQLSVIKATTTSTQPKPVLHLSVAATPGLHIAGALLVAKRLSTDLSEREQIQSLINQIETARRAVKADRNKFAVEGVVSELEAALNHTRTALSMIESASGDFDSAKVRLGWAAARLKRASERLKQK